MFVNLLYSMSGTGDEEKSETGKVVPLDLASKVATVKTVDGKAPLLIPGPLRVLTQSVSGSGQTTVTGTMLTASIVPQAVLKQGNYLLCGNIFTIFYHKQFVFMIAFYLLNFSSIFICTSQPFSDLPVLLTAMTFYISICLIPLLKILLTL